MGIDRKKKKLLQCLEKTLGIIASACRNAGIARATFYNWLNSDQEFKVKVDDILEKQKDVVESAILHKISEGDTAMIIFYAKTKMKDRGYCETQNITLSAKDEMLNPSEARQFINNLENEY